MAATHSSLPLYDRVPANGTVHRVLGLLILFLLFSLLGYRLFSLRSHGFPWLLAFVCESCFTMAWFCTTLTKWNPIDNITYPEHILHRVNDLPALDIFVTTSDAVLEPPILTVNTVLSLLAVDYPAHKLACYVSDDACSPLIFYSLVEASNFAKLWVPFCKKYGIQVRAPFQYFASRSQSSSSSHEYESDASSGFRQDWQRIKDEYEELSQKIQDAAVKTHGSSPNRFDLTGEFEAFANAERHNHPTIIKIILENREGSETDREVPHLIYISREKRPKQHHHYKAGAMNVLTRVSGLITNAPFMLNVDCDMYANNPQVVLHAMCLLLGSENERDSAFVQAPQKFYDALKDDPYGNQFHALQHFILRGMEATQGPMYGGTGCFHRRKVIYGLSPDHLEETGGLKGEELRKRFGNSTRLCDSAACALSASEQKPRSSERIDFVLEAAYPVAGCGYEHGTCWGKEVGWVYGSTTEDIVTGLKIHRKGWRSIFFNPDPPVFLGCAPMGGPTSLAQQKRWATGLLEVFCSEHHPILATVYGNLKWRACLTYLWILTWTLRSVAEICYAILPAYCLITDTAFLPKVTEICMLIPVSLLISYYLGTLWEYKEVGQSVKSWWNNQQMAVIISTCARIFGLLGVILKLLGISQTVFEVTRKDQPSSVSDDEDDRTVPTRFTFDESPVFIPGTTILLLNLTSLAMLLLRLLQRRAFEVDGLGLGEVACSFLVILYFSPFLRGLFGKGKCGIPRSIMYKSIALTLLLVHLCTWRKL